MARQVCLKPFFGYFGSKWRIAQYYPAPRYPIIIEPFAGAAGYSIRHHTRNVWLCEKYKSLEQTWRYIIRASASEIRTLPIITRPTEDIRTWSIDDDAREFIAWNLTAGDPRPRYTLSQFALKYRPPFTGNAADGQGFANFWGAKRRERIASQVESINHWRFVADDYRALENVEATWFIDPPYARSGKSYLHNDIDYGELSQWCRSRKGQVIVCEQDGATWLPFRPFVRLKASGHGRFSERRKEMVWTNS